MIAQTLRLSGTPYVVVPEKEYLKILNQLARYQAEELADAALVRKRLKDRRALLPLPQVKKELGK